MAKTNKIKVPKELFGFKLSKGTRKDLRKLLKMLAHPDKRTLAMAAATGLATFLLERFAEKKLDHMPDMRQPH